MKKIEWFQGMSNADWLMLIYIFKWAHFWVAPLWVFVGMWVIVIAELVYETIRELVKKMLEEAKRLTKEEKNK